MVSLDSNCFTSASQSRGENIMRMIVLAMLAALSISLFGVTGASAYRYHSMARNPLVSCKNICGRDTLTIWTLCVRTTDYAITSKVNTGKPCNNPGGW